MAAGGGGLGDGWVVVAFGVSAGQVAQVVVAFTQALAVGGGGLTTVGVAVVFRCRGVCGWSSRSGSLSTGSQTSRRHHTSRLSARCRMIWVGRVPWSPPFASVSFAGLVVCAQDRGGGDDGADLEVDVGGVGLSGDAFDQQRPSADSPTGGRRRPHPPRTVIQRLPTRDGLFGGGQGGQGGGPIPMHNGAHRRVGACCHGAFGGGVGINGGGLAQGGLLDLPQASTPTPTPSTRDRWRAAARPRGAHTPPRCSRPPPGTRPSRHAPNRCGKSSTNTVP